MKLEETKEEEDLEAVPMLLHLDRGTVAWLARLHRITGSHPNELVASMLRDIRVDDEAAHARRKKLN